MHAQHNFKQMQHVSPIAITYLQYQTRIYAAAYHVQLPPIMELYV